MSRSLLRTSRLLLRALGGTRTLVSSPHPDITVPSSSLPDYVWSNFDKYKEFQAVVSSGRSVSYGRLKRLSYNFGAWLNSQLGGEQVFTVVLPNSIELAIACLGAFEAGVTLSTLNPDHTSEELAKLLQNTRTTHLLTYSKKIHEILEAQKMIEETTKTEFPLTLISVDDEITFRGVLHFEDLLRSLGPFERYDNPTALVLQSLNEKGAQEVRLSHSNLISNVLQVCSLSPLREKSTIAALLPMFHGYGLTQLLISGLSHGATIVAFQRFDPQQLINNLKQHKVTVLPTVSSMVHYLSAENVVKEDLSYLETVTIAGKPMSVPAVNRLKRMIDGRVLHCYGLTEGSIVFHEDSEGSKPGSVGKLVSNTQAKVIDSSGCEIKNGEGEIWLRGPQLSEFGDWVRSGDMGYADENGDFFITTRVKGTIRADVYRVSPYEIETVLLQHPDVKDAVVFGVAHTGVGETPVAVVVTNGAVPPRELKNFVAARLAPYKHLSDVIVQNSIPRNADGTVDRKQLSSEYSIRNEYVSLSYI